MAKVTHIISSFESVSPTYSDGETNLEDEEPTLCVLREDDTLLYVKKYEDGVMLATVVRFKDAPRLTYVSEKIDTYNPIVKDMIRFAESVDVPSSWVGDKVMP